MSFADREPIRLPRQFLWQAIHRLPGELSIEIGPGIQLPKYESDARFHAVMTFLEEELLPAVREVAWSLTIDEVLDLASHFVVDPENLYPLDPEENNANELLMFAQFYLFPMEAIGGLFPHLARGETLDPKLLGWIRQAGRLLAEVNAPSLDDVDDEPDDYDIPLWSSGPANLN